MLSDTVTLYTTPDKGRTSHLMFPTATRDATAGNNAKNSDSSCREPWALEPGSPWVRYTWTVEVGDKLGSTKCQWEVG